ncbi:hypothetical protein EC988_005298 [Linderina pennispora]|nr:hypothetical protein EC988_005298 [Linderina pennispora]
MSFEYLGPTRYDSSDSEDEQPLSRTLAAASFIVRTTADLARPETVIIDLTPAASSQGTSPVGVVYAPTASAQYPVGSTLATTAGLSRIVQHADGTVRVLANAKLPVELQHGWVRAVLEKLQPQRLVVVDSLTAPGMYCAPAVLASVLVVGVAAAAANYAETYRVEFRHVRRSGGVAAEDVDGLFARPDEKLAGDSSIGRDAAAALYL